MSLIEAKNFGIGVQGPAAFEAPLEVTEEEIDAFFVLPENYTAEVRDTIEGLSQYDLDQLIIEIGSQKDAAPGIRGEIRRALLAGNREELRDLGSTAMRLALRGAELRVFRSAARQAMAASRIEAYHR